MSNDTHTIAMQGFQALIEHEIDFEQKTAFEDMQPIYNKAPQMLALIKDIDYALRNIWALDRKKFEEEILPRTAAIIKETEVK